jgi:hypothetical protein
MQGNVPLLNTRGACQVLWRYEEGLTCHSASYRRYHRTYPMETLLLLHYVTFTTQQDMTYWVSFCAFR